MEEIFSYLSFADLVRCSTVSVKWRDAANSDKLWRRICAKSSWQDPLALYDIESNFLNKRYQFSIPRLSDSLSPLSDWKMYYCQQKFLSYNWHRGRYVTHWFGENIRVPRTVTFASTEPKERLFFPIVERVGYHFEFNIIRIDGRPKKVSTLEKSTVDDITVVCVAEDTIAYVIDTILKVAVYRDGVFSIINEYDLQPLRNELFINTLDMIEANLEPSYFLKINSNHLVAGHESYYFHVWNRETGDKVGFVEVPVPKSTISAICLFGDDFYFAIEEKYLSIFELYRYNILSKHLALVSSVSFVVKKILSNDLYLIVVVVVDINRNDVLIYDRLTLERESCFLQDTSENYGMTEPQVLLAGNLLFYLQSSSIKVLYMPSCKLKTEFRVTSPVFSMYHVRHNLIVIKTRTEVEVWDWEKGIKLYTPCVDCDTSYLYHDMTRLTLIQKIPGEAKVIAFW